jgi:hypothetical protein
MARLIRFAIILVFFPALLSAVAGWYGAAGFLHPEKTGADTRHEGAYADVTFCADWRALRRIRRASARRRDVARLESTRSKNPTARGYWYFTESLTIATEWLSTRGCFCNAGYGLVMMDARAHGASGGAMASYGWLERRDTSARSMLLEPAEHPAHVFALR